MRSTADFDTLSVRVIESLPNLNNNELSNLYIYTYVSWVIVFLLEIFKL